MVTSGPSRQEWCSVSEPFRRKGKGPEISLKVPPSFRLVFFVLQKIIHFKLYWWVCRKSNCFLQFLWPYIICKHFFPPIFFQFYLCVTYIPLVRYIWHTVPAENRWNTFTPMENNTFFLPNLYDFLPFASNLRSRLFFIIFKLIAYLGVFLTFIIYLSFI